MWHILRWQRPQADSQKSQSLEIIIGGLHKFEHSEIEDIAVGQLNNL